MSVIPTPSVLGVASPNFQLEVNGGCHWGGGGGGGHFGHFWHIYKKIQAHIQGGGGGMWLGIQGAAF